MRLEDKPGPAAVSKSHPPPRASGRKTLGPAAARAKKGMVRCSQVCVCAFLMGGMGRVGAFGDVSTYLYVGSGRKRKTHVGVHWRVDIGLTEREEQA